MTRRPIIAANWKLHQSLEQTREWWRAISQTSDQWERVDVVVAPTALGVSTLASLGSGTRSFQVYGQNCHWEPSGAFTGEVSAALLHDAGARGCIVGHSERRQLFGETDEQVALKLAAVLGHGLNAILCVGETDEQREAGDSTNVVTQQLRRALDAIKSPDHLMIAYEPVWAIGTGKRATLKQIDAMHRDIRGCLRERFGPHASTVRVLYGGSVKPAGACDIFSIEDVDGALVGGASLEAKSFSAIIQAAVECAP